MIRCCNKKTTKKRPERAIKNFLPIDVLINNELLNQYCAELILLKHFCSIEFDKFNSADKD